MTDVEDATSDIDILTIPNQMGEYTMGGDADIPPDVTSDIPPEVEEERTAAGGGGEEADMGDLFGDEEEGSEKAGTR